MNISGNTVFIPGSTSGIGLALALQAKGNHVIIGGRRTALVPGQENSPFAMDLDEFVAEVITLFETQPDAKEIQVARCQDCEHALMIEVRKLSTARGD